MVPAMIFGHSGDCEYTEKAVNLDFGDEVVRMVKERFQKKMLSEMRHDSYLLYWPEDEADGVHSALGREQTTASWEKVQAFWTHLLAFHSLVRDRFWEVEVV